MTPTILILDRAGSEPMAANFTKGGVCGKDPFSAAREIGWQNADVSAGRVVWSGEIAIESFPHTEMLAVLSGRVTLTGPEGTLTLGANQGAVITEGARLTISAEPGSRWTYCATTHRGSKPAGITELSATAPLTPSAPPPAAMLTSAEPSCRAFRAYQDDTNDFSAGLWDSTPYSRKGRPQPHHELMHVLKGSVTFVLQDGEKVEVNTGDTVFVSKDSHGSWDSREPVAKFYGCQG